VVVTLDRFRWWHLEQVLPIERDLFGPEPWTEHSFWSELGQTTARHYVILMSEGAVVGYAGLCDYPDEAFVQTMAVARSHQGRGLGRVLLEELLAEADRRGQRRVLLEVRADNLVDAWVMRFTPVINGTRGAVSGAQNGTVRSVDLDGGAEG
jgi:ribosomal-protein-alanine N-acetyltransferase